MTLKSINPEQRLYVISTGKGYSCLSFDVAEKWRQQVAAYVGDAKLAAPVPLGTAEHYAAYLAAMSAGADHAKQTGTRDESELIPALRGLEGKRVEVTTPDGEKSRFWVGKSTGWRPIHLEIKTRASSGGGSAYVPEGATVRVVQSNRRR